MQSPKRGWCSRAAACAEPTKSASSPHHGGPGSGAGSGPVFPYFCGYLRRCDQRDVPGVQLGSSDHGVERLAEVWNSLRLEDHARFRPFGLARLPDTLAAFAPSPARI